MSSARIQKALLIPRSISNSKLSRNQTISKWICRWISFTRWVCADNAYQSQEHPFQGGSSHATRTPKHPLETYTSEAEYEYG